MSLSCSRTLSSRECSVQYSRPVHAHTVVTRECGVQCSRPARPHTVVTHECSVQCSRPVHPHKCSVHCVQGLHSELAATSSPPQRQTPRREASPQHCGCSAGHSWRGRGPAQSALLPFLLGLRPNVCAFNAAPRMKAPALPGASTVGTRARRPQPWGAEMKSVGRLSESKGGSASGWMTGSARCAHSLMTQSTPGGRGRGCSRPPSGLLPTPSRPCRGSHSCPWRRPRPSPCCWRGKRLIVFMNQVHKQVLSPLCYSSFPNNITYKSHFYNNQVC